MIIELIISVLSFLILVVINEYSTWIALPTCIVVVYNLVRYYSITFNKQIFANRFAKIWLILLDSLKFIARIYLFFRHLFSFQTKRDSKSAKKPGIQFCGDALTLENEINTLVQKISYFYLYSWYNKISENDDFINLLKHSIQDTLLKLCSSVSSVDKKNFSFIILQLYLHFFSHFVELKKTAENFTTNNFQMKHWAMKDGLNEWCYLQSLVSALLDKYGPIEIESSLHSKYSSLLHTIVVEILTETLIQPLVRVLSDPSIINMLILKILISEIKTDKILVTATPPSFETTQSTPTNVVPTENLLVLPKTEQFSEYSSQNLLSVPSMQYPVEEELITSENTPHNYNIENLKTIPLLLSSGIKSCSNSQLSNYNFSDSKSTHDENSSISCDKIKRSKSADFIRQMPQLKALNEKDYDIKFQKENNTMLVAVKFESSSNCSVEQAEEAVEIEIPTLFTDVKIIDTFQQNKDGPNPYTLYCIQYSALFHDIGSSSNTPQFVTQVVSIKRRFSEFATLHSRLEDNPNLKHYLKGIKGPSKWLTLPFSNLDKKYIAERKVFLDGYLKELCSLAPVAHSAELQEFLAYGGDARISFVKRSGEGPRIDKFLARGVKGAIDIFKTALPIPAGEIEGLLPTKTSAEQTSSPEQKFSEHYLDFYIRESEIKQHVENFFQNSMENSSFDNVSPKIHSCDLKIKRSSLLRNLHNFKTEDCCNCFGLHDNFKKEEYPFGSTIIELLDSVFEFNTLKLGDLRTKLNLLLAPLINRYVIDKIDSLSEEHLAKALHLLHVFLWPDEINKNKSNTQDNSSAIKNIVEFLEDILSSNSFVNSDIFNIKTRLLEKIKLFLLSLQHEEMNKCLLFHFFDAVIEFLCSKE